MPDHVLLLQSHDARLPDQRLRSRFELRLRVLARFRRRGGDERPPAALRDDDALLLQEFEDLAEMGKNWLKGTD